MRAAVAAVRASGIPAFINARTDTVWMGAGDEAETIARLRAYAEAGADGLFVPGATDPGLLCRLVAATPLPLNVLAGPALPPVDELARLGVARVSSGSGPARLALSAAYAAAQELLGSPGTYGDGSGLSYVEVNRIMVASSGSDPATKCACGRSSVTTRPRSWDVCPCGHAGDRSGSGACPTCSETSGRSSGAGGPTASSAAASARASPPPPCWPRRAPCRGCWRHARAGAGRPAARIRQR